LSYLRQLKVRKICLKVSHFSNSEGLSFLLYFGFNFRDPFPSEFFLLLPRETLTGPWPERFWTCPRSLQKLWATLWGL